MAKLVVLQILFVLTTFAPTAGATTIEVTSGRVYTDQFALFDACAVIPGLINSCGPQLLFVPAMDGTTSIRFHVPHFLFGGILYDGPDPVPPFPITPTNLQLNFVYNTPLPQFPSTVPPYVVPRVSTPFTMTGTLDVTDPATQEPVVFDLVGDGILSCCYRPDTLSGFPLVNIQFDFTSVPEPSSVWLLACGIWPFVFRAYRRRAL